MQPGCPLSPAPHLQSQLGLSPLLHGQKDRYEALASGREGVLDARGHLAEVRAGEEAVLDQLFELLGERGFGDIADAAAQLAEVAHIFQGDVEEDLDLPFPADHALDSRDRSAALDLLAANMLTVYENSELHREIAAGNWQEAAEVEKYEEVKELVGALAVPTEFAMLGASNPVMLQGRLPEQREQILAALDAIIADIGEERLRSYRTSLRHL